MPMKRKGKKSPFLEEELFGKGKRGGMNGAMDGYRAGQMGGGGFIPPQPIGPVGYVPPGTPSAGPRGPFTRPPKGGNNPLSPFQGPRKSSKKAAAAKKVSKTPVKPAPKPPAKPAPKPPVKGKP